MSFLTPSELPFPCLRGLLPVNSCLHRCFLMLGQPPERKQMLYIPALLRCLRLVHIKDPKTEPAIFKVSRSIVCSRYKPASENCNPKTASLVLSTQQNPNPKLWTLNHINPTDPKPKSQARNPKPLSLKPHSIQPTHPTELTGAQGRVSKWIQVQHYMTISGLLSHSPLSASK